MAKKKESDLEKGRRTIWIILLAIGEKFLVEHYFLKPARRWRIDFIIPRVKIGIEYEGGTWLRKGHTGPITFRDNCEKYNAAALNGWMLLRFTSDHVRAPAFIEASIRAAIKVRDGGEIEIWDSLFRFGVQERSEARKRKELRKAGLPRSSLPPQKDQGLLITPEDSEMPTSFLLSRPGRT